MGWGRDHGVIGDEVSVEHLVEQLAGGGESAVGMENFDREVGKVETAEGREPEMEWRWTRRLAITVWWVRGDLEEAGVEAATQP